MNVQTASWRSGGAQMAAPLPKLFIEVERERISTSASSLPRRDSLSSSRTGDSGYNSDPDISLSPLDCFVPDQRMLPTIKPYLGQYEKNKFAD